MTCWPAWCRTANAPRESCITAAASSPTTTPICGATPTRRTATFPRPSGRWGQRGSAPTSGGIIFTAAICSFCARSSRRSSRRCSSSPTFWSRTPAITSRTLRFRRKTLTSCPTACAGISASVLRWTARFCASCSRATLPPRPSFPLRMRRPAPRAPSCPSCARRRSAATDAYSNGAASTARPNPATATSATCMVWLRAMRSAPLLRRNLPPQRAKHWNTALPTAVATQVGAARGSRCFGRGWGREARSKKTCAPSTPTPPSRI